MSATLTNDGPTSGIEVGPSLWRFVDAPVMISAQRLRTRVGATVGFFEAILDAFNRYATFTGRSRRADYWWFALLSFVIFFVARAMDIAGDTAFFEVFAYLPLVLPGLAVLVRRLHDTGRSGAWVFFGLVPIIGGITLLVFAARAGDSGPNRYGPVPQGYGRSQADWT